MSDQLQDELSRFYRQIEAEWQEGQADVALSFNELAVMYDLLADGMFSDDYEKLAELNLEVVDA